MGLVPESKEEKKAAYLFRFNGWLKTRPEREQRLFCIHGRYTGFKAALSFMCKECNPDP